MYHILTDRLIHGTCKLKFLINSLSPKNRFACNKSSTFLSGYCTPQEGYIEPFIPAASCGVFWKVLDKCTHDVIFR